MMRLVFLLPLLSCSWSQSEFMHFWDDEDRLDSNSGRSCGDCYFPMIINDTRIYGCVARNDKNRTLMCKSTYDEPLDCDDSCPDARPASPSVYVAYSTPGQKVFTMQCSTSGSPNPNITWIKNEVEVIHEHIPPYTEAPEWVISYIQLPFGKESRGEYSCVASNGHATSSSEGKLFFSGTDSTPAPTHLRVLDQTGTSLTIQWNYEGAINMHASYYVQITEVVEEYEDNEEETEEEPEHPRVDHLHRERGRIRTLATNFTQKYLLPGVTYKIVVKAEDFFGISPPSESLEVTIDPEAMFEEITNVTISDISETSATVTWNYTGDPGNQLIFDLKIFPYVYESLVVAYQPGEQSYTIYSLESHKEYEFTISAHNQDGLDIESALVTFRTKPTGPEVTSIVLKNDIKDKIKIVCRIKGTPPPNVTVTKDGGDVPSSAEIEAKLGTSSTKVTVVVSRSFMNYGEYTFVGTNLAGSAEDTIHVTYEGKHPETLAEMMLYVIEHIQSIQKDNENNMMSIKKDLQELKETTMKLLENN